MNGHASSPIDAAALGTAVPIAATPSRAATTERFDVAILGAGFEGGLLGTILGHQGMRVLMIDAGTHPRFALGESTVRHTFKLTKIIGERFGIPEIKQKFSRAAQLHDQVASSFGEKRNFGFLYHREGQHQNPEEANMLVIVPFREGYEAHLYRQDVDSFLTYTAVHYGAVVRYKTSIVDIDINKQGVALKSSEGETFRARFVVDCSGTGSVLARLMNLRDNPPRLKLNTRCLFSHMIDVAPYDDLPLPSGVRRMPERWYNGTCHHVFDGGWLWVIPFNNRKGSTNQVCSVGLQLDNERFPRPKDLTPEQEWEQFLSRFPSIYEQFKRAKVVRDWASSDRLQTSCKQAVGERWALAAGAYGSGFIDALFSRGLSNSSEVLNALAPRLLKALRDDDFSVERFEYMERLHQNTLHRNDQLVKSCYTAFRDYDLWNAWFRIWALGVGLGDLRLASALRRFQRTRDESVLPDAEEPMGLFMSNHAGFGALFDEAVAETEAVEAGQVPPKDAANRIFHLLANAKFSSPAVRLGDPSVRCINVGRPATLLRTLAWLTTSAPPEMKAMSLGAISDLGPMRLLSRRKARDESEATGQPAGVSGS